MKLNKKQQKAAIKYELLQMNFKSIANEMQQVCKWKWMHMQNAYVA